MVQISLYQVSIKAKLVCRGPIEQWIEFENDICKVNLILKLICSCQWLTSIIWILPYIFTCLLYREPHLLA